MQQDAVRQAVPKFRSRKAGVSAFGNLEDVVLSALPQPKRGTDDAQKRNQADGQENSSRYQRSAASDRHIKGLP